MTTIGTYAVVFYVLHSVKFIELLPMVWIGVEYGHQVYPISLHLWNVYLLPIELADLECHPHHVIFIFPFSNRTQNFLIEPILFFGGFPNEYTIVGLVYPV